MSVQENLFHIKTEINFASQRAGRNPDEIQIVAVTKNVSVEKTKEALDSGIIHIGENRAEGLVEKWESLQNKGKWHYIGSLQSKKVKKIIDIIDYIHSLDRLSLAEEIQKRANRKVVKCFVQVNVSGEATKAGLHPSDVIPFIRSLEEYPAIEVVGLMTMAPFVEDSEQTRPIFKSLKELQKKVQACELSFAPCTELSMGMSNDYPIAIEEGATFIRIGTSLVGK